MLGQVFIPWGFQSQPSLTELFQSVQAACEEGTPEQIKRQAFEIYCKQQGLTSIFKEDTHLKKISKPEKETAFGEASEETRSCS